MDEEAKEKQRIYFDSYEEAKASSAGRNVRHIQTFRFAWRRARIIWGSSGLRDTAAVPYAAGKKEERWTKSEPCPGHPAYHRRPPP